MISLSSPDVGWPDWVLTTMETTTEETIPTTTTEETTTEETTKVEMTPVWMILCLQLSIAESDNKNNEVTLAIIKDSSPFPYPDDFIELFKAPNETFDGLHDITVVLRDSPEKVLVFDLRKG